MANRPAQRYYDVARERPFLAGRVCGYLRQQDCTICADEIIDGETYAPACRLLAEEVIAIVAEAIASGPERVEQDR